MGVMKHNNVQVQVDRFIKQLLCEKSTVQQTSKHLLPLEGFVFPMN